MTVSNRPGQRAADALRAVRITRSYTMHAEGSVLIEFGHTKVLCTASVEEKVPPHKKGSGEGWVTAEYGMLPRATHTRSSREAAKGKQSGRTQEIQRLIGRSLRAVFDLKALGERTISLDCDVLQADGGTRTASITGAFVAAQDAVNKLIAEGKLAASPIKDHVAAISVGILEGQPLLDLEYVEDSTCDTDMNVVMTGAGHYVEVQGTAEGVAFTRKEMDALLALAEKGIGELIVAQKKITRRMKLVLASNNQGKLAELQALFAPLGVELVRQADLGIPEAPEPHRTFIENALAKARHASQVSGLPALADDAGLCVEAFGGLPGVDTAFYATQFGYEKGDDNNVRALLEQMQRHHRPPRGAGEHPGGAAQRRRPGAAGGDGSRRGADHAGTHRRPGLRL